MCLSRGNPILVVMLLLGTAAVAAVVARPAYAEPTSSAAPAGTVAGNGKGDAPVRVEVPLILTSYAAHGLVLGRLTDEGQGELRSMAIHIDDNPFGATSLTLMDHSNFDTVATFPVSGSPVDITLSPEAVAAVAAVLTATGHYPEVRLGDFDMSRMLIGTPCLPVFVDSANVDVSNPTGSSWATAFPSLQAGIDAAAAAGRGDVWVFNGIYHEAGEPGEPARSIRTGDNVRVFGSFNERNGMVWSRDTNQLRSIIVGRKSRDEFPAPHLVVHDDKQDVYFDGFTLLGGACVNSGEETGGGGLTMTSLGESGKPVFNHLRIIGNTAGSWAQPPTPGDPAWDEISWTGEGDTGTGTLSGEEGGGGVFSRWCPSNILNTTILGNIAMSRGGGVRAINACMDTQNVELIGNATLRWTWDSPASVPRLLPGPGSAWYSEQECSQLHEHMTVWNNTGSPSVVAWPWPIEDPFPQPDDRMRIENSYVSTSSPGPLLGGAIDSLSSQLDRATPEIYYNTESLLGMALRRAVMRGVVTGVETVPGMIELQDSQHTWPENALSGYVIVLDVAPIVAEDSPLKQTYGMISHNTANTLHALAVTEAPFPAGPVSYVLYAPELEANSPGVDVASSYSSQFDLRGRSRGVDGDGILGEGFENDLGAIERHDAPPGIVIFDDAALEAAVVAGIQAVDSTVTPPIRADQALSLTTLELRWRNVTSLRGIEYCQNLTHLDVFGNQIVNLAPLSNLKKLTHLDLGRNPITDLSPLARTELLTYFEAGTGDPRRTAEFANPDPATYVGGTPAIEDDWVLDGISYPRYIGLAGNRLRRLPDLDSAFVTTLILANNPIEEFYDLFRYVSLEVVDFSGTGFYDPIAWSFAYDAPLRYVDLSNTSVQSLDEVPRHPTIETLKLNDNALPDFWPPWGFENVRVLELARNNFTSIAAIAALPGLAGPDAFVDLRGNPLNREARCVDLPALRARMDSPDQVLFDGVCVQDGEGEESSYFDADQNDDAVLALAELLRVIQFYNLGGHHCAAQPGDSEDGFLPGTNAEAQACSPHTSDYSPQDWRISLSELLRVIQFYNARGYVPCEGGEDGFCPVL